MERSDKERSELTPQPNGKAGIFRRLKDFLGIHTHERKVFCVGRIAFVKCVTCGDESIPWEVGEVAAEQWNRSHPNAFEELQAIRERTK